MTRWYSPLNLIVELLGCYEMYDSSLRCVSVLVGKLPESTTEAGSSMNELEASFPPSLPPRFLTDNSSVITAQTGSTALVPCVVHNIGDGMVSDCLPPVETWLGNRSFIEA